MATLKNIAKQNAVVNLRNGYVDTDYTVDLTTVQANNDNKCYLVDKRLVDFLLARVTKGTLDDIKEEIKEEVNFSNTKDELFERLDHYIYLNKIVNMLPVVEEKEQEVVPTVGKIALPTNGYPDQPY